MAAYNFTVRATDNLGAFADKSFTINVLNQDIRRFVVVGSTALASSTDGITWAVSTGNSGGRVSWGNGKWVVYSGNADHTSGLAGLSLRTSTDAITWTTAASGIPTTYTGNVSGSSFTYTVSAIQSLKWANGLWTALVNANGNGNYGYILEYTSPDLTTWTFKAATGVNTNNAGLVFDHASDAGGNVVAVVFNNGTSAISYRAAGATTLTQNLGLGASYNDAWVTNMNGVWVISPGTQVASGAVVYTSTDGTTWSQRAVSGSSANNLLHGSAYVNGALVTKTFVSGSNVVNYFSSTNAGRTWSKGPLVTLTGGAPTTPGYASSTQGMAYYNGTILSIEGQNNVCNLQVSTDGGASWTYNTTVGTQIGTAQALAVRNV